MIPFAVGLFLTLASFAQSAQGADRGTETLPLQIQTSTIPPTVAFTLADAGAVLKQYADAYRKFFGTHDVTGIRDAFPGFSSLQEQRLNAQARSMTECRYTFSNIRVTPGADVTARVTADTIESCKPRTSRAVTDLPTVEIFELEGTPAGWRIVRQYSGEPPFSRVDGVVGGNPPSGPPLDGPLRVGDNIKEPKQLKRVDPVYPQAAKVANVQGVVFVQAIIGKDGKVRDAKVLRGPDLLSQAALDAVKKWRYAPTLLAGVPVEIMLDVTVVFTLD